ncbi:hypothetical protein EJB05_21037, partial [Eragrostis curvula]
MKNGVQNGAPTRNAPRSLAISSRRRACLGFVPLTLDVASRRPDSKCSRAGCAAERAPTPGDFGSGASPLWNGIERKRRRGFWVCGVGWG